MTIQEHWITSDLHVGHVSINTFCDRGFADVDEMNEAIVEQWNATVAPGDRVLILGDLAMGKINESLIITRRLNGYKVLLTGNHDRCWPALSERKSAGWDIKYMRMGGMDEIRHGTMRLDLDKDHRSILACHFPYSGDSQGEDRFSGMRPDDTGEWIIHGHVHDAWLQSGRMINVGIDAWGGRLVHASELGKLIADGVQDIPRIPWPKRVAA